MSRKHDSWKSDFPTSRSRGTAVGIPAKGQFGHTWWAKRWVEALAEFGWSDRLARGKTYAKSGQVISYQLAAGRATAKVQGSADKPYAVTIRIKTLTDDEWDTVIEAMSEQALFAARLLAGEMPEPIEQAFDRAGLSLFPHADDDLNTRCTCPDETNPCQHIAAVYLLLGEVFDIDPFMIFTLRGMSRQTLLARLCDSPDASSPEDHAPVDVEPEPMVTLGIERFWTGPPHISLRIENPLVEAAVLKRLGEPAFWTGRVNLTAHLAKTYRKASATALNRALAPSKERPAK